MLPRKNRMKQHDNGKFFPLGKLDPDFLEKLLGSLPQDGRVIVGPKIGEDAAVLDFGEKYLVVKTDPITFTFENIGWYVVNINANDIACMGATPRWFLPTLLLPQQGTSKELIKTIFDQMKSACQKLGISLIGGHTEVTFNLDRPIAVGQMIGEVARERLVRGSGAKAGDAVLLTKGVAIEGTHVIYQKKKKELKRRVAPDTLKKLSRLLYQPGISVVKEALLATRSCEVHCMHDPTEGGLRTGLWELAYASGTGIRIEKERIPVLPETETICKFYGLDPLGLLASGALILTLSPSEGERLIEIYQRKGIKCSLIGKVVPRKLGLKILEKRKESDLGGVCRDEMNKVL
ncbi:Thiamine-monophosphate kinase [subsurface metagenome]